MILHDKAISGNTEYGIPQIKSKAKYVDPPPKPTLEYNIAVTKNNIASINMINYLIMKLCK